MPGWKWVREHWCGLWSRC